MMIARWLCLSVALLALNAHERPVPAPSVMLISVDPKVDTVTLTSPEAGVPFDIDSDGVLDQVAWTEWDTAVAFIALDLDGDGRITSGKELFGSYTVPEAGNGPDALIETFKSTGAPLSGAVEGGHKLYDQLLLWVDRNHNGISEHGELRAIKEVFTAIGMGFVAKTRLDEHGNWFRFMGWAELRTGGPEQGRAASRREQRQRRREYFEVVLKTR
jgi:hypothetical protein